MLPAFQAMRESLLAVFGQEALLRGEAVINDTPVCIAIRFGVQVVGSDENVVASRTVATIDQRLDPRIGDTISHPDGEFVIDAPLRENGYLDTWIVRKA